MDKQLEKNKMSPRRKAVNILVHVFLAVLALIWILPIVWIVLTSFRAEPGAYTTTFLPQGYTLNNYIKLRYRRPGQRSKGSVHVRAERDPYVRS